MTDSIGLPKLPPENTEAWPATPLEIAQEYFPDASKEALDHIIWGLTGFPHFWNISEQGQTPLQCFHYQLREVRRLLDAGVSIDQQTYECWDKPMLELKEKTKVRAYYLWEAAGRPEGRDKEFYYQAQDEWHERKWE